MGEIIDFNPITYSDLTIYSTWIYEEGFILNLDFDPKEWKWRKLGGLQESSLVNYQIKRDIDKFVQVLLTLAHMTKNYKL